MLPIETKNQYLASAGVRTNDLETLGELAKTREGDVNNAEWVEFKNAHAYFNDSDKSKTIVHSAGWTDGFKAVTDYFLTRGDDVVVLSNGFFGEDAANAFQRNELSVRCLEYEDGRSLDAEKIKTDLESIRNERRVEGKKPPNAIFWVDVETSNGVKNPTSALAKAVRNVWPEATPWIMLDAAGSVGLHPVSMKDADVILTMTQKGPAIKPEHMMMCFGERAVKHLEAGGRGRYFTKEAPLLESGGVAAGTLRQLESVADKFASEGSERVFQRCAKNAELVRKAIKNVGLELVSKGEHAHSVVAFSAPQGISAQDCQQRLEARGFKIDSGRSRNSNPNASQNEWRIGLIGDRNQENVEALAGGIENALGQKHDTQEKSDSKRNASASRSASAGRSASHQGMER